ncbi:MAG: hypothetical protein N4J56_008069 [Chroococcidiopsis sp. SAG 2025]|uniref:hypothetical protein n=1 Tax=Chroococcidiopsis sp. SAG 2025 TaxID=171389 RepID=UPI00293748C1|nr:hypothetical protein [Chroococcidiopsis sp. SAG 2025]MDV2997930.1 hypothetical protein [Chroococcidiopsis sp. SAG 2025]MDV2998364.1 hypothetical protein [Chroococcidiopsis sp. SAG 2025]
MAAQTAGKSNSALGAFYRRLRSRLGSPKAITATAHKIARIFYKLWTTGGNYTDPGMDYYEQRYYVSECSIISTKKPRLLVLSLFLSPQKI